MSMFAGILSGEYIVWHNTSAQITVKLTPALGTVTRLELVVGLNKYNPDANIKVWSRSSSLGTFVYLADMQAVSIPSLPGDGTFIDVVFRADIPASPIGDIRFIVTKDGVAPREMTPVKKYSIYNGTATPIVGGSKFDVNSLGWQTSEVFETIFRYLDAPISVEHTVDIENETHGQLPESRIRNDELLARVADSEWISGVWDFEQGQLKVERATDLPLLPEVGRLFQKLPSGELYIGDGAQWHRLLREDDVLNQSSYCWIFTRQSRVPRGSYLKVGDAVLSAAEGVPATANVKLSTVYVRVNDQVVDGQAVEILKNGSVVETVQVQNGTQMGYKDVNIVYQKEDIVSVRAAESNVSFMASPRVTLLYKSV